MLVWHAREANAALAAMTDQIAAGDSAGAAASIESARSNTRAAQSGITSLPVSALNVIPYFRTNLTGADTFLDAALQVLEGADVTNDVYARLTGDEQPALRTARSTSPRCRTSSRRSSRSPTICPGRMRPCSRCLRTSRRSCAVSWTRPRTRSTASNGACRSTKTSCPTSRLCSGRINRRRTWSCSTTPASSTPVGGASLSAALLQFDQGQNGGRRQGCGEQPLLPRQPARAVGPGRGGPYYAEENARTASRGRTCTRTTGSPART